MPVHRNLSPLYSSVPAGSNCINTGMSRGTGTVLAIKNGVWSSHKARQGLWHKGGSIIMIFVSVLTDILLGLTLNHISGLTLPFSYDMLLTPIVLFWYIVSELGSILENAEKMGAPIPPLLKNILEKMRDSNDDKNTPSL